jgi:glycosyltransferase involved in cell wall biosynthesis
MGHGLYPPLRVALAGYMDRWLRKRALLRIVASRYMQRRFMADFGLEALYLPHGTFPPPDAELSNPFTDPTAVYMGSLFHSYDHDIVFEAAARLRRRGLAPRLEVIGDGPEFGRWATFTRTNGLDNISMPGRLTGSELWRRLRHAHVLLFPLRDSEVNACRCPGKIFHYAGAKRPIIATRVGEVGEVLGDGARYVACDAESFALAIEDVMASPRAPDVPYAIGTWDDRATELLTALANQGDTARRRAPRNCHA